MNSEWMKKATNAAADVYSKFLNDVVIAHVVNDRDETLGENTLKKVKNQTYVDPRALRLMTISGKGGHSGNPEKQTVYDRFYNVTLLDHLLSVTRGALTIAAMDWLNQNPEMNTSVLNQRLSIIAVISFMHDLDKDLKLSRNESIEIKDVAERMERYGLEYFLETVGVSLSPDQLRYLIEKVEATQAHRHTPDTLPPREFESLPLYIRLADQLDSTWLLSDPENGGFSGVLKCLKNEQGCLRSDFLKHWKKIQLFDPHHPFLLDELQNRLSFFSLHLTGVLPLIEIHQDGHLFMLLPEDRYDEIIEKSLDILCKKLPFKLELNVSNRGIPALYNGQPDHEALKEFVQKDLKQQDFSNLFKIKRDLMNQVKDSLDDLLSDVGLQPRWQEKGTTQLITLFSTLDKVEDADKEWLYTAAHLVMLLNLKVEAKPKDKIPTSDKRETDLLKTVDNERPDWLKKIEDDVSRRTITSLWVTALAYENEEILENIWGDDGLLKRWLEGEDERPGFNKFIKGEGTEILKGVKDRFQALLSGQRIIVEDENAKGRCIFTDEPVPFEQTINQAVGLYGVKVSAFSGRDNRPEMITSENAHTNVGPSSVAEHKLRTQIHAIQGGKDNGVPALISSPTTTGLFGGLAMTEDKAMNAMSLYDLNRLEIKKGNVLRNVEMYKNRFRMARLERVPEKMEDQVNTLEMMLKATRRIGRPFHVFRGLPTLQKAYFYYDAMPKVLVNLIGSNSLYIEQIPEALKHLRIAKMFLETQGLGYDTLKLYAMTDTRFKAICLAWCHLRDKNQDKKTDLMSNLYREYLNYREDEKLMNQYDGALVKFGKAASGIQQRPWSTASASEELLVFKLCLDTVNAARREKQNDVTSLVYAIAGELETNLVRKEKAAAKSQRDGKNLIDGCIEVAEIFVKDVWLGVLQGRSPSQKSRRVLSSIYRIAFLTSHKERGQEKNSDK